MNRRTCPDCGARSYSSCNDSNWDCPICGKNLNEIPNDQNNWSRFAKMLESDPNQDYLAGDRVKNTGPRLKERVAEKMKNVHWKNIFQNRP